MLPNLPHRVRGRVRDRVGVRVSVSYLSSAMLKSIEILAIFIMADMKQLRLALTLPLLLTETLTLWGKQGSI